MIKKILFLLSLFLGLNVNALLLYANDNVGTTSAQFLKIDPGARSAAMGSAFTGIADDINSIYWNPGGLSYLTYKEASFVYSSYFEDSTYNFISYVHPTEKKGTFGVMITNASSGDMSKTLTDQWGNYLGTNGSFNGTDLSVLISYAKIYAKNLSSGLNLKFIQQKIDTEAATAYALDFGFLYKIPIESSSSEKHLQLGLNVSNLGTPLKFIDKKEDLPLIIRTGIGYNLTNHINLGLDINKPLDNDFNVHTGFEYDVNKLFFLRAGYRSDFVSELGTSSGFTMGFGCDLKSMGINYAFVPYGDLGITHRLSLTFKIGEKVDLNQDFESGGSWWQ